MEFLGLDSTLGLCVLLPVCSIFAMDRKTCKESGCQNFPWAFMWYNYCAVCYGHERHMERPSYLGLDTCIFNYIVHFDPFFGGFLEDSTCLEISCILVNSRASLHKSSFFR
jgi:hypothetical protein